MKSMKFSDNYMKLMDNKFHTLRRMAWWAPDETVIVKHPSGEFKALILSAEIKMFKNIPDEFLIRDTWLWNKNKPLIHESVNFIENLLGIKIHSNTIFIEYWLNKIVSSEGKEKICDECGNKLEWHNFYFCVYPFCIRFNEHLKIFVSNRRNERN